MKVTECPQCGATALPSERKCSFCSAEYFVTSLAYFSSLNDGEVSKYIKYYKEILSEDAGDTEGLLGLGLSYLHMGNYSIAKNYFEKTNPVSHSGGGSENFSKRDFEIFFLFVRFSGGGVRSRSHFWFFSF